ncbi:MAG: hypothetical protein JO217_09150 [Acidobacteriaceae bacterium]|nr:hypothetical protein [Acidobacteriaceae bacterium]
MPGTPNCKPGNRSSASGFKYYLHDSADAFRIQLLGDLTDLQVSELNGCWNTAKTTLGSRQLVLDVTGLKSVSDSGREWLERMVADGAVRYPDNSSKPSSLAGSSTLEKKAEPGVLTRVVSFFRGSRTVPASSTTQAP